MTGRSASVARCADGGHWRHLFGRVVAGIRGTHSTRVVCAPIAATHGKQRNASDVTGGRSIVTGTTKTAEARMRPGGCASANLQFIQP